MDLGLSGRRALVTAASRGLGRACAEALVREGAAVFIASRDGDAIRQSAEAIGAAGHRTADVADGEQAEALVAEAAQRLGGLDILVVNAGGPPPGTFESTELPAWEKAYHLTLMSAVRLTRAALDHLKASGQGRVVNITSTSVREPIANLLLSNAMRAAVTGMAKTLSTEVARLGITVNNIAPGRITTARTRELGVTADGVPMGRMGEAEELGALCAFLCSKQAGYITGQTIAVDGGLLKGVY